MMATFNLIQEFLFKDVSLWGDLKAPVLSWMGAFGILLLFLCFVGKLVWEVRRTERPFGRIRPALTSLPVLADGMDEKRLKALSAAMQKEPMFRQPWGEFRETLLMDHVKWYQSPRIFNTRLAEEFFTQDSLLGTRINMSFYNYVPAVLTGIGLLLTFVAFFIGLSKLHADGQTITGIQGLINGLSGKFLTSIVGLVGATLFALIEKPLVYRLLSTHQEFVGLLNGVFPRRTTDQILTEINLHQSEQLRVLKYLGLDFTQHFKKALADSLALPITDLTTALRGFKNNQAQEPWDALRHMGGEVTRALPGIGAALGDQLAQTMKAALSTRAESDENSRTALECLVTHLTNAIADQQARMVAQTQALHQRLAEAFTKLEASAETQQLALSRLVEVFDRGASETHPGSAASDPGPADHALQKATQW